MTATPPPPPGARRPTPPPPPAGPPAGAPPASWPSAAAPPPASSPGWPSALRDSPPGGRPPAGWPSVPQQAAHSGYGAPDGASHSGHGAPGGYGAAGSGGYGAPGGYGQAVGYAAPPAVPADQGNIGLALVGGIAGAFVAGLVWWGIVATTRTQVTMVAIGVGWVVAQAVLICCQQRNRLPLQAIAGTFTLVSLAVSEYFIQRTLFIKEYGDRLDGTSVPLWQGFENARLTVEEVLKDDPLTGLFWLAAVVAAVVVTGSSEAVTRRD